MKKEEKTVANQGKGAEKKTVREKTQEVSEKTGKEVGKKEDRNKAVEKKADKSKTFEKKADKSIAAVNREEKVVQRTSIKRKVTGAGMFSFSWTRGAQRDTEEYRNGYPVSCFNTLIQTFMAASCWGVDINIFPTWICFWENFKIILETFDRNYHPSNF